MMAGDQLRFMIQHGPGQMFHYDKVGYRYFYTTETPASLDDYIAVEHLMMAPRGTAPIKI